MDFAIAGFPKCGTTTLMLRLHDHRPFLDVPTVERHLAQVLGGRNATRSPLRGIKDPDGMTDPGALRAARLRFPALRVIVAVRHPTDQLLSFLAYRAREWRNGTDRFAAALRRQWHRPPDLDQVVLDGADFAGASLATSLYSKHFAREDTPGPLLVVLTELLAREGGTAALARIAAFLGVPPLPPRPAPLRSNSNPDRTPLPCGRVEETLERIVAVHRAEMHTLETVTFEREPALLADMAYLWEDPLARLIGRRGSWHSPFLPRTVRSV